VRVREKLSAVAVNTIEEEKINSKLRDNDVNAIEQNFLLVFIYAPPCFLFKDSYI
jgi:hypothetical protein